jgi:hypothetical protein
MHCLLISSDLMARSSLAGPITAVGAGLKQVESVDRLPPDACDLVLIDLAGNLDIESTVAALRHAWPEAAIVAYGPHVHAERLSAARDAGCDEVLTRGQFHSQMREIVAKYLPR